MTDPATPGDDLLARIGVPPGIVPVLPGPETRRESADEAAERVRLVADARIARWDESVPMRFRDAAYDDLSDEQDPRGVIAGWLQRSHSLNLVLLGDSDVGKTHAAYAVANAAARQHRQWVAGWYVPDLNDLLRPNGDSSAMDVACEADLIVLDDLGKEAITEWTLERLGIILDTRTRSERRTIITTNLTGQQMLARYGDAIVSRLQDRMTVRTVKGERRRVEAPW